MSDLPAGHKDRLVCAEALAVHLDGDISQDIPAAESVEVEQDVACMASELYAAICRRGHDVRI